MNLHLQKSLPTRNAQQKNSPVKPRTVNAARITLLFDIAAQFAASFNRLELWGLSSTADFVHALIFMLFFFAIDFFFIVVLQVCCAICLSPNKTGYPMYNIKHRYILIEKNAEGLQAAISMQRTTVKWLRAKVQFFEFLLQ